MPTIIRNGITYGGGGGSGNASNKYSTEEQVVGTWIDGKPIYRRVYYVDKSFNSSDSDFSSYVSNSREIDTIINAKGYKSSNKGFTDIHGYIENGKLLLSTDWSLTIVSGNPNILMLEYTKTTD